MITFSHFFVQIYFYCKRSTKETEIPIHDPYNQTHAPTLSNMTRIEHYHLK